ncbi:MAG: hypothetical protein ACK4FZ_16680 [Vogesella sp.]|uniref:hypothetical protein n=1 Tax=Vogesella sp. TaxID=1904252 RepID=UPI003918B116
MATETSIDFGAKKWLMLIIYISAFLMAVSFLIFIYNPEIKTDNVFYCSNGVNGFFNFSIYWIKNISLLLNVAISFYFLMTNWRSIVNDGFAGYAKMPIVQLLVILIFSLFFVVFYPFVVVDVDGNCEAIRRGVISFVFFGIITNVAFYIMIIAIFAIPSEMKRRISK